VPALDQEASQLGGIGIVRAAYETHVAPGGQGAPFGPGRRAPRPRGADC
jgi:hypothetical protein